MSSHTDTRQARLEAFFSQLEILRAPLPRTLQPHEAGVDAVLGSLDELMPGAARDFAVLLAALEDMPPSPDGPQNFATESDAKQAVRHLYGAIDALDKASEEIRSFIRLSEPLTKRLAGLATEGDPEFNDALAAAFARRPQSDVQRQPKLEEASLSEVCEALAPFWYAPGTTAEQRKARFGDPPRKPRNYDPNTCIKNAIALRNHAAHRFLPSGARLVPCLQTTLAGLASLLIHPDRLRAIHARLRSRGRQSFLLTEYLARVQEDCAHRIPDFIDSAITGGAYMTRRIVTTSLLSQNPAHHPRTEAEYLERNQTIQSLLERHDRLWLQADGGRGKSEYLRCVARDLARDSHLRLLPVYIELKSFHPQSARSGLLGLIRRSLRLSDEAPLPALHNWRPVFLLDGFNEIDRVAQHALFEELKDIEAHWAHFKLCVASRTGGTQAKGWVFVELLPLEVDDMRKYLASFECRGVRLDVEAFWRNAGVCSYWSLILQSPLFLTLCGAYALQTGQDSLPESESHIIRRLIDDYYRREIEKSPGITESDLLATRLVLQEMAWETFARDTMALPESDVRQLVERHIEGPGRDPFQTVLKTGIVYRDSGEVRFILEPIRDYLVSEQLLRELTAPQVATGGAPLLNPLARLEQKLQSTTLRLLENAAPDVLKPRHIFRIVPRHVELRLSAEQAEISWCKERLASGAKIFQFVIEQAPKAQRAHYVSGLVNRELNDPIDYFGGGFYFFALEAAVRINAALPAEQLLNSDQLVRVFQRALALGEHFGEFALQAIAAVPTPGLGERLAKEITVAPGVSLADFPGKLRTKSQIKTLAREMSFPAYCFFELWRLDPEWADSRVPDILEFMVASHATSDNEHVVFLLTCYPTAEFEKIFGGATAKPEDAPNTGRRWRKIARSWDSISVGYNLRYSPVAKNIIPLVLILQDTPQLFPVLEKLVPVEANRSSQLVALLDMVYMQLGSTADGTGFWGFFLFYSGEHNFMRDILVRPKYPDFTPEEMARAMRVAYELWGDNIPSDFYHDGIEFL